MRPQLIMFLGWIMTTGTLISVTLSGGWLGDTDVTSLNAISGFKSANVLGVWTIPVPNIDFVTSGLGALLKWDFAFFNGTTEIVRWLFITTIGAGVMWGLFSVVIYTISGLFPRLGR